jgi:hypothetical protein
MFSYQAGYTYQHLPEHSLAHRADHSYMKQYESHQQYGGFQIWDYPAFIHSFEGFSMMSISKSSSYWGTPLFLWKAQAKSVFLSQGDFVGPSCDSIEVRYDCPVINKRLISGFCSYKTRQCF